MHHNQPTSQRLFFKYLVTKEKTNLSAMGKRWASTTDVNFNHFDVQEFVSSYGRNAPDHDAQSPRLHDQGTMFVRRNAPSSGRSRPRSAVFHSDFQQHMDSNYDHSYGSNLNYSSSHIGIKNIKYRFTSMM